jgi:hypothetical protein
MTLQMQVDQTLEALLERLKNIVSARIQGFLKESGPSPEAHGTDAPPLASHQLFRRVEGLRNDEERILLLIALVPHLQPNFFESIILENLPAGGDFLEFGGVKGVNHRGMLPTGETAQFILAGMDLDRRLGIQGYFSEGHAFSAQNILWLEPVREGEPAMSGRIVLSREWADRLLLGREPVPRFGPDFPAKRISTNMVWEDAVLHPQTLQQVGGISEWLVHHRKLEEDGNLGRKLKPGYRVLFHGPSGTGKTLTAALLGKQFGKDVYRIDLSLIVSKYIGETEKNLEGIFKRAESRNWILFFDEADALFGKRTNVQSAHDKYANQEVSYLLQRVEDYPGLLVLASNFKNNLDDAFIRRFQALIHFPMPNGSERLQLWRKTMPAALLQDESVNLPDLARQYEMSGAAILNAVQYAALQAHAGGRSSIMHADLLDGVRKEFLKEEKSI